MYEENEAPVYEHIRYDGLVVPMIKIGYKDFFCINSTTNDVFNVDNMNDEEKKIAKFLCDLTDDHEYVHLVSVNVEYREINKGLVLELYFKFGDDNPYPYFIDKVSGGRYTIMSEYAPQMEVLGIIKLV